MTYAQGHTLAEDCTIGVYHQFADHMAHYPAGFAILIAACFSRLEPRVKSSRRHRCPTALRRAAALVVVNLDVTTRASGSISAIHGPAGQVLPGLIKAA